MMVQDKLLTAILNSMFQNMVSIGTGLILLLTQSMQAGVGTLTVGTSPCLSTVVCEFLLSFFGEFMALYSRRRSL